MKHIRMFDNAEQAETILSVLEYITLSAISGESIVTLKPGVVPPPPAPDPTIPFYIEDVSGSENAIVIKKSNYNGGVPKLTIEASLDGLTWETTSSPKVPANGKLYLRCSTTSWGSSTKDYNYINPLGEFNVGGNIMSLLYGSNFTGNETTFPSGSVYTFTHLFFNSKKMVSAANLLLPATTLIDNCYEWMFAQCVLTTAPAILPATTLAKNCYANMFSNSSLTNTPELPAETLAPGCYSNMFSYCTSLATAPELPATILTDYCYYYMFQNCTSLTTAPELPAETLASKCYNNMFYGCTSLTSAPELPATTLTDYCYQSMFQGCTSLTTAPELPATTLQAVCYMNMFNGCTNLNYIKCMATNRSATNCTKDWVNGVASTGTFVKNSSTSWGTNTSNIPSGWIVEDA